MSMDGWARRKLVLAASVLVGLSACVLAGCGDFWQSPNSNNFTLTSSPTSLTVAQGSSGSSTVTVTPANSFTGTVGLTCAVTSPTGAVSATTCSLSSSSVSISSTTAQTATLTAATSSTTTSGAYQVTVTGTSGSTTETTTVCVAVGTSSSGCSSTAGTSGNFYILNSTTISGYSIKAGALTALTNSPYALPSGVTPHAMAVDPSGSYLYVSTDAGIFLYDIGKGGALTLEQSGAVIGDLVAYAIKVDSTGNWLLDSSGQGYLFAYPIGSQGIPAATNNPPSAALAASTVQQMAISADNKLIAVAEGSAGTQAFTFAAANTSPFATVYKPTTKGAAISVAFSPQTSFLYIGETGDFSTSGNSGGLRIIPITSDVLGNEPTSVSPYQSGGTGPYAILAAANGYVYVANWVNSGSGSITAFLLNTSGPTLTVQSNPAATGAEPRGLVADSTGSYLLAVNYGGSPEFNAYTFDATTTGLLDSLLTGSTGTSPIAIVAVPK